MMQKKKLKSLAMFLATISTSLFIPLTVHADSAGTITESDCSAGCVVHTFDATTPGTIKVAGGKHKIILKDVTIDATTAGVPAIEITKSATTGMGSDVEIELQGTNTIKSGDGFAGLYVPSGNSVTITGTGSLDAQGGKTGAGIGSQGLDGAAGNITIQTTVDPTGTDDTQGKVTAQGGLTAAGIGGGQGGGCGKVSIISGIVDARGGSGGTITTGAGEIDVFGGAGIGGGGGQREGGGGEIILKGGDVTAIGGPTPPDNELRNGIDCKTLSSDGGSANIYSNSPIATTTNIDRFNGVVWMLNPPDLTAVKSGEAYGNAILNKDLAENTSLLIRPGCSVTIPSSQTIHMKDGSSIVGDKDTSIINADNIISEGLCVILGPQLKVTLSREVVRAASNPNLIYTGKDLTDQALIVDKTQVKNDRTYTVVDDGWTRTFNIDLIKKDCILDAGTYRVTYSNPNYTDFTIQVTVDRRELKDDMIASIDNEMYTGQDCTPSPVVTYNNMTLKEGIDYQPPQYQNNREIGTASLTIEAVKNGNYQGTATKEFTISRASLSNSVVTIKPESGQYNTKKHTPQITVTLEGETLKEGDDYTVTPSTDDFTSAGTITYTVEGAGNYAGSAQPVKYTITRVPITINLDKELKAESREYDGTTGVKILDIEFKGILPGDEGEVELKTKGIVESANVGTYNEITLANLELTGKKGGNYEIDLSDEAKVKLSEPVEIWKKTPKEANVTCTHSISPSDPTKFLCTVEVPLDKGVDYLFAMDSRDQLVAGGTIVEKEDENGNKKEVVQYTYDGIEPGSTHTFYVRSEATDNVEGVEIGSKDHEFTLLARDEKDKPGAFTLTFAPNPADPSLFIATIPPVEGAEYSFDGENFSSDNTKTDCKPLTEYTGYIRYAATAVLKAGESVSDTRETPAAEESTSLEPRLTRIDPNAPDENLVPPGLKNSPELGSMDSIIAKLTATLSAIPGYTYERMAFYDLTIYVKELASDGTITERPAEAADFQNGGLSVTIAPPDGTSINANDFVVAHMFGETVGENLAGNIETPSVSKTANGLTFTVNGTSPIAVAWKEAAANDPGNTDNPGGTDNPNGGDDPNGGDPGTPGGDDTGNGDAGLSPTAGTTGTDNNPNGGGNGNGDGTDGSDANAEDDNSALDALKETIASLAPKTGDTNKIIMWIVIAIACIAVIVGVKVKSGKGKKGKTSGSAGTKTNSASKSTATTKKTGTSKPAATAKKTGNTKSTAKKTTGTSNSKKK